MTLFIIGNGFDLNHGYKTSYEDFKKFLSCRKDGYPMGDNGAEQFDLYEILDRELDDSSQVSWGNFEESLGYLQFTYIQDQYDDEWDENESDADTADRMQNNESIEEYMRGLIGGLRNTIGAAFSNFIVENTTKILKPKCIFLKAFSGRESFLISFNYSWVLERAYGIKKDNVFHIHGTAKYIEPQPDYGGANPVYDESPIIFGHSPDKTCKADNIDERQEIVDSIVATLEKPYNFERLKKYFDHIRKVDEVQIIGHSLAEVDSPYFEMLAKELPPNIKCTYWCHEGNRIKDARKSIKAFCSLFPKQRKVIKFYGDDSNTTEMIYVLGSNRLVIKTKTFSPHPCK